MSRRVLVVIGTRPEAIKMAPVIRALAARPAFELVVCATAQHRAMLDQVLELFQIVPDIDLDLMEENQTLPELTARVTLAISDVVRKKEPAIVLVQGDTTTAMVTALASFYARVPVGHVEAGLRTDERYAPFPEEMNRRLLTALATWHFAPTDRSARTLRAERVPAGQVFVTGNTVIDALQSIASRPPGREISDWIEGLRRARRSEGLSRLVLVTVHRRESLGEPLQNICSAVLELVRRWSDVQIVAPAHLNPKIRDVLFSRLGGVDGVTLVDPLSYEATVFLLRACHFVLTDSGGLQEEAPTFGKPVLVLRDVTERPEGVEAGVARVVGTSVAGIVAASEELLGDRRAYEGMARAMSPYGDGRAAERIADILEAAIDWSVAR